jgi:uncharacterized protein YbaR (Trm112 family)
MSILVCPDCHTELVFHYDQGYCNNLNCINVYPLFLKAFLNELSHYFDECIINRLLILRLANEWSNPIEVLNLRKLPDSNDDNLYQKIAYDLTTSELDRFQNGLFWLDAFKDENIIKSIYYPTLTEIQIDEYIFQMDDARAFFNAIAAFTVRIFRSDDYNVYEDMFYQRYFRSPTIQAYIRNLLLWYDRERAYGYRPHQLYG